MPRALFLHSPFDQNARGHVPIAAGLTIQEWLDSSGMSQRMREQPVITLRNKEELLEEQYCELIEDDDLFVLAAIPSAQAIPYIVSFLKAYWVELALFALSFLISYLTRPEFDEGNAADTVYSLALRGNRNRLGQPKPFLVGTWRSYPDFAALPFVEFDANGDEVWTLYYEVSIGQCSVDTASMRYEDTLLSSFQGVVYEVLAPGVPSTMYPSQVIVSGEVANLTIPASPGIGPYAANPTATDITRIDVDLLAGSGLYRQRSSGRQERLSVPILVEAREIDDAGAPVGSYFTLGTETLSGNSRTPIRRTFSYAVSAARYEVRVTRTTADSTGSQIVDDVQWGQLRGYIADTLPVPQTTRICVRIRASDNIGSRALQKFNVEVTRMLRRWDTTVSPNAWSAYSTTWGDRIPWVFAEIATASYGGNRADAFVDLAGLAALDATLPSWARVNGVIDTKMSVWDALKRVAFLAQGTPIDRNGVLQLVRDEEQIAPSQFFNMRNIVRGTFSINRQNVTDDTPDHVVAEFFDETQDYRVTELNCVLPGGTTNTPERVRMWGVTTEAHAWQLGMFIAAENKYRRAFVEFESGLETRIPNFKETVVVSHYLMGQEGYDQISADVIAYNSGTKVLTLSESGLTGRFTSPYVMLRDLEGEPRGPYVCSVVADNQIDITDAAFTDDSYLVFSGDYENPKVSVGEGSLFTTEIKVTQIEKAGEGRFKVRGFIEEPTVYSITDGEIQPSAQALPSLLSRVPDVYNLAAKGDGTTIDPIIILTWDADYSDRFDIQYSRDAGATWIDANGAENTVGQRFVDTPEPGTIHYRVAGITAYRGAWATIIVNTATAIDNTTRTPEIIDSLVINAGSGIVEGFVSIDTSPTNLPPTEVQIHRVTDPDSQYGDASMILLGTWPMAYDATNDRFVAQFVDANVAPLTEYRYFATARNQAGAAADHYPTGTNVGVLASVGGSGTTIYYQSTAPVGALNGDYWQDSDDLHWYRFNTLVSPNAWQAVTDPDIQNALNNAATAQATADGKIVTFVTATPPVAEAHGDIWFDSDDDYRMYRWNANVSPQAWESVRDLGIAQALADASNAQATADGKINTFYQTTPPTAEGEGDLWVDTDDNNRLYRWSTTVSPNAWIDIRDGTIAVAQSDASTAIANAASAQATADGKVVTFIQTSAPTAEGHGDLWFDSDDDYHLYRWNANVSPQAWEDAGQFSADWARVFGTGVPQSYAAANNPNMGGILFNGWMTAQDYERDRPLGWWLAATTASANIGYQDASKSILRLGIQSNPDSQIAAYSSAFAVSANMRYRIRIRYRGRIAGTNGLYFRVSELDTDLPEGKLFVARPGEAGPTYDEAFRVEETRPRTGLGYENVALPTAWSEASIAYTPTSTAKWASIQILNWTAYTDELWIDRASVDPSPLALANLDTIGAAQVNAGSLYRVANNGGYTSGQTDFKGPSSWVQVVTTSIVAPASITNVRIRAHYDGAVSMSYTSSATTVHAAGMQWRLLDHDNVVVAQGVWEITMVPTPINGTPTQRIGVTTVGFDIIFNNTYINANSTNTYKVEVYTAETLTTAWSKYENLTLVMYDAAGDDS